MAIRYKPKYVLDADSKNAFDRIEHQELPRKVKTGPTIRRQLKAWLQAGVIDQGQWFQTERYDSREPTVTAPGEYRDPRN